MSAKDIWFEFYNENKGVCGLCGNSGILDTIQTAQSPRGTCCGIKGFCICPNGRAKKRANGRKKWKDSSLL